MKQSKVNTKSQTCSLIHLNRKKKETWSLCRCIPPLSAQRRNEARRRRPTKAPICCSTFVEQGPMGNFTAITVQYVFEQLHRGRDSQHVHPCTQACTKHGNMNPTHINLYKWTHTHSSFIDLGIKCMVCFLDVRCSSATDTATSLSTQPSDVWPKPALWRIVC